MNALLAWRPSKRDLAEAALIATVLPLYYLARGSVHVHVSDAFRRSIDLIDLERRLGILWEADLQEWVLAYDWLVDALNAMYLWGHLPVIGAVALWLYLCRRPQYLLMRNAFLISGAIGLIVYFLYPVAPPRLMPAWGFVDTITEQYGIQRPGTPGVFINHYAAVPSLHFGWNLLAGVMACLAFRRAAVLLTLGVGMPLATLASIVFTANHFILDAIAGALAVAAGIAIALAVRRLARPRAPRDGAAAGWREWLCWLCGVAEPVEGAQAASGNKTVVFD